MMFPKERAKKIVEKSLRIMTAIAILGMATGSSLALLTVVNIYNYFTIVILALAFLVAIISVIAAAVLLALTVLFDAIL